MLRNKNFKSFYDYLATRKEMRLARVVSTRYRFMVWDIISFIRQSRLPLHSMYKIRIIVYNKICGMVFSHNKQFFGIA